MLDLAPKAVSTRAALWLRTVPDTARWSLRGDVTVSAAAGTAIGLTLSADICRAVAQGTRAALCLGPDEHLLLAPAAESESLHTAITAALVSRAHSLVDVSHRQMGFEIAGPHAEWLLNGGCPLDLSQRAFPVGMCTRTVFAKAEVMLWRTSADTFRFEVWRSYATYCLDLLREISAEIG
jgi:sarcosine oxidase, subunit gamma